MPSDDENQKTAEELAAESAAATEAARIADEEKHLSDAGKAALKAERDARKAAAKEAAEAKAELETLRKEKAEADAAKAKAEEEEATRKGEFEQLATKRAEEIQAVTGERDTLKIRLDTALALISASLDQDWKAAPDQVTKLYRGDDTDVLAKRQFLTEHADIIAALSDKQQDRKQAAGFGRTPNPNGDGRKVIDADARKEQSGIYKSTF